ncbi:hypothetical protein [Actinophytocola sp.]|uniref:hypothetical protein n=1 Tax=Actinophytocola sp. TaxID=1872138 RepID=UPI003D6B17C8
MVERKRLYMATEQNWDSAEISDQEWASMSSWYAETHGEGGLDLVPFLPFMREHRPDALKRYRQWNEIVQEGAGLRSPLPGTVIALLYLHYYTTRAYRHGILYEVITSRMWQANKAEVRDVLTFAWLHAGPLGITAAAESSGEYLSTWDEQDGAPSTVDWPAGWAFDSDTFAAGLDFSHRELSTDELAALKDWHRRTEGEVPPYVSYLGDHYPEALKVFRYRYETAIKVLPKQMIPLMELHLAFLTQRPAAARRAAHHAATIGVTAQQLAHVGASVQVYLGSTGMDIVAEVLA